MGSKERILRLKDETRTKILDAALSIVKTEGWQALSMRKIADQIEYTAPIIYEYFDNKEGILFELSRRGYLILAQFLREAKQKHNNPEEQLEAMWIAYWDFAFANKEHYKLMFGVDMVCCDGKKEMPEEEIINNMLWEVIATIYKSKSVSEDEICVKYHTYWSIIHGLISINLIRPNGRTSNAMNLQILREAIKGITLSINN